MRIYPIPLIAAWLLFCMTAAAQPDTRYALLLKSGTEFPSKNISTSRIDSLNNRTARNGGKTFAILQFEQLPTIAEKQSLLQAGIELLDYIPNNAYTVSITGTLSEATLQQVRARAIIEPTSQQKMQPQLARGLFPAHAIKTPGTIDLWISFPRSWIAAEVKQALQQGNFDLVNTDYQAYRVLGIRIAA